MAKAKVHLLIDDSQYIDGMCVEHASAPACWDYDEGDKFVTRRHKSKINCRACKRYMGVPAAQTSKDKQDGRG